MLKNKNIIITTLIALLILLVLLITIQSTDEVAWGIFVFAFTVLFGASFAYESIIKKSAPTIYKAAIAIAIVTILILFWINGAVGIIGSEDNPANLMYLGVIIIVIIGSLISQFKPRRMALTLSLAALVQILVPIIALIIWRPKVDLGVLGIFILNGFFVAMFIISASLFKRVK